MTPEETDEKATRRGEDRGVRGRGRGLSEQLAKARRAGPELVVLMLCLAGVLVGYANRQALFGVDLPVRIAAGILVAAVGWAVARAVARLAVPALARRDIPTAGPIAFLVRLVAIAVTSLVALRLVGIKPTTLAAGSAVTAVILGLAAQQTLGNLFAGMVLLGARPFAVGDWVQLRSGGVGGELQGSVLAFGLLYTSFADGGEAILVPNSVVLNSAIVAGQPSDVVEFRVRVPPGMTTRDLQHALDHDIDVPRRPSSVHMALDELSAEGAVVRVRVDGLDDADRARLVDGIAAAVATASA